MKPTLLLTALLCVSSRADFTVDIWSGHYSATPYTLEYPNTFVGSYTIPSNPFSPELNIGPALDWRPFGLTWFRADIHGSFDVVTPGTSHLSLGNLWGSRVNAGFSIDGVGAFMGSDINPDVSVTLPVGTYSFHLGYLPSLVQTDVGTVTESLPSGKNGIAIIDDNHSWGPSIGVPESSAWWLWLVPAGILLLRIDCRRRSSR